MTIIKLAIVLLLLAGIDHAILAVDMTEQNPLESWNSLGANKIETSFLNHRPLLRVIEEGDETDPFPDAGTASDDPDGASNDSVAPVEDGIFIFLLLAVGYGCFTHKKRHLNSVIFKL